MTDAMTDTERRDLDTFRSMLNQACAAKLKELAGEAFIAKCLDQGAADGLADRRQRLLDLPGTIKPGTRAELAAQWPADFPPLHWGFEARDDFALMMRLPPEFRGIA
jgi:hypothetical protein